MFGRRTRSTKSARRRRRRSTARSSSLARRRRPQYEARRREGSLRSAPGEAVARVPAEPGRLLLDRRRTDARGVRRNRGARRAAVLARIRPRLGYRRVQLAPARDRRAHVARGEVGTPLRAHARDPKADRTLIARGDRPYAAR